MIEQYVKELLDEKGSVAIPNLGTFYKEQQAALLDFGEGIVSPPTEKLMFTTEVKDAQKEELRNYIFEKNEMFASQIDVEIEKYVEALQGKLVEEGEAVFEGVGALRKIAGELVFFPKEETIADTSNFGLPKLEVHPIAPNAAEEADDFSDEIDDEPTGKSANAAIPWLVIAPLVLLAIAVAYFFYNPSAYENLKAMFPQERTSSTTSPAEDSANQEAENTSETTNVATNTPETEDSQVSDSQETPTETTSDTPTEESIWVSKPTNRFYLIAGSFNNEESARKALKEAQDKGYSAAKIVNANNRFRLSIGDYATRSEATSAAVKFGEKDYKGVWPLKY